MGLDDIQRDLAMGKDRILARLTDNPYRGLVEDTTAEMAWWACFVEDRQESVGHAGRTSARSMRQPAANLSQFKRAAPKIGRNERCPCGSGKKYKKCCGA
jgi:uncharacterized protein YecA (UPF0149 family)